MSKDREMDAHGFGTAKMVSVTQLKPKDKRDDFSEPNTTDASQTQADDSFIGLQILDQYKVIRKLGAGGMGAVYLADQVSIGRKAAVKFLLPKISANEELTERFYREAKSVSALNHPNIVEVYNFGQTADGVLYLAMEFIDGEPLSKTVSLRPFTVHQTCELGIQLADALVMAHSRNVIHRDLKPENIIIHKLNNRPSVKVLDFGLAKIVAHEGEYNTTLTTAGNIYGTPKYMSPEQAQGNPTDFRADIYSLGVILYQMLTGSLPVSASTLVAQLVATANDPPRPFSDYRGLGIPEPLQKLIMQMLAKEPGDRPNSMKEVRDELESCRQHIQGRHAVTGWRVLLLVTLFFVFGGAAWYAVTALLHQSVPSTVSQDDSLSRNPASAHISAKPVLVKTSQAQKPKWVGHTDNDISNAKHWVFYGEVMGHSTLEQARSDLRDDIAEDVLMALIANLNVKNYAVAVYQPILAAKSRVLQKIQKYGRSGKSKAAEQHRDEEQETTAYIYSMLKERFPDLLESTEEYWEQFKREGDPEFFNLYARFSIHPSDYSENYYTQTRTVQELGLTLTHFFPGLTWVHGKINGTVVLEVATGSPSEKSGLQIGDVITRVDKAPVNGLMSFMGMMQGLQNKNVDSLSLLVSRRGKQQTVRIAGMIETPKK